MDDQSGRVVFKAMRKLESGENTVTVTASLEFQAASHTAGLEVLPMLIARFHEHFEALQTGEVPELSEACLR